MSVFPDQMISRREKEMDDFQWAKDCIDALIDNSSSPSSVTELSELYEAVNGKVAPRYYSHVLNQFSTKNPNYQRFPAKLRNYNIIKPVIDLIVGEKPNRPNNHSVIVNNSDSKNIYEQSKKEALKNYFSQKFANELNNQGIDTGVPSKPQPELEAFLKEFDENYKDSRAIVGQEALNILEEDVQLPEKFQEGFYDYVVSGYVYSYKTSRHSTVEYEIINPKELRYPQDVNELYLEDMPWVVRETTMSISQIIDKFYDVLSESQLKNLKSGVSSLSFANSTSFTRDLSEQETVYHVYWKSMVKIGILKYLDELGIPREMQVSEEYTIGPDEEIEWYWINEGWEGYKIGNNYEDMYLLMRPVEIQRRRMDALSICKGPYNGRAYSTRNAENISMVKIGLPYQVLYDIIHYQTELAIVKNKGRIALLDIGLIPRKYGWDEDKFMYFASSMGFAFVDTTAESPAGEKIPPIGGNPVIDLDLSNMIKSGIELLMVIRSEWEETFGINRQRKGDIMASDRVGSTERAVFQSSIITEELFRKFEEFEAIELQGLLDVSQFAWRDGKRGMYVNSNKQQVFYDLDSEQFAMSEYGVYAVNSGKERNKLQTLKMLAQQFSQNNSTPYMIAEIIDSENFAGIKKLLKEFEDRQAAMAQSSMEAQEKSKQDIEKIRIEDREDQQAFLAFIEDKKFKNERELKLIELKLKEVVDKANAKSVEDRTELDKTALELEKEMADSQLEFNYDQLKQEKELRLKEIEASKIKKVSNKTN